MKRNINILKSLMTVSFLLAFNAISQTLSAEEKNGAMLWPFDCETGYLSSMSDNGKWGLFKYPDYDEQDAVPRRFNLLTGATEELPVSREQNIGQVCKCLDITDDGEIIVGSFDNSPAYYKDGEWHYLPVPRGMRTYSGPVCNVTPDGRWMVAWLTQSFTNFKPLIWHDGVLEEIGTLPGYDDLYERGVISRGVYNEHIDAGDTPNYAFFKISDDGRKVLVGIDHNYPGWGCCYVLYDTTTKTFDWIVDNDIVGKGRYVSYAAMSNNGKWVSAAVTGSRNNPDGSWDDYSDWGMYDVENKKYDTSRGGGSIVGNDGRCYSTTIFNGQVSVGIEKILRDKYGIDYSATTGYDGIGWMLDISSDLKTMMGQSGPRKEAFSVTLPVTFFEAAQNVNLLNEATIYPGDGCNLSKLIKASITFPYSSEYVEGKNISLQKEDEVLAYPLSVTKSGNKYEIVFRNVALSEGEHYNLVFDAGAFVNEKASSQSTRFSVSYRGRADEPMKATEVVPLEGSAMIEMSVNNYVIVEFSTDILISDKAVAYLYEKGSEHPICYLGVITNGHSIAVYPGAARKLANEKEYEVRIPAGTVTDLNGLNPNEEIVLTYKGSYLPDVPVITNNQLFFDDFTNPNVSLNHFLQFEGDHLTPSAEMQEWGFDNDNTPWNFSIRDEEDYNYCAASTSEYKEEGASDNWLVIPRLTIENKDEYLTFKSQSYKFAKGDRLKVYVWESDEMLGALDRATIEKIRTQGDLVYDRVQSCGSYVDKLAGDWLENEISLSNYNGKNIYIAFLDDTQNGSCVFLDDICVEYRGSFMVGIDSPQTIVDADGCALGGVVTVNDDNVYDSIHVSVKVNGADTPLVYEAAGQHIDKTAPFTFRFADECKLQRGVVNRVELRVSLDDQVQTVSRDIKSLYYNIPRKVLIEEGTGTWCGWCPEGFVALDYLQQAYPGQVAEISIHYNDQQAMTSYAAFHNFGAYPAGRVDRTAAELAPMIADNTTGMLSLTSGSGNETFADVVEQRLAIPAEASVEIADCGYRDNGDVVANVEVKYALSQTGLHYNLLGVLTEYDVPTFQSSYLSGMTDPLVKEWAELGESVYYELPAVARAVSGTSYYGTPGLLPENPEVGKDYAATLKIAIPETVQNKEKLKIVVAIINAATGEVVNCAASEYLQLVGVEQPAEDCFRAQAGKVYYGDSDDVEVYSLSGIRVRNENLHGIFIVRRGDKVKKLVV